MRCVFGPVHSFGNSEEPGGGGGGGGTLIFLHIRMLGPFFWVQYSDFQYFLGFSEK